MKASAAALDDKKRLLTILLEQYKISPYIYDVE